MKKKRLLPFIISLLIISAAGCFERSDMFTLAKNGVPVVYGVSYSGTAVSVYEAAEGFVNKYTFTSPASINSVLYLAFLNGHQILVVISTGSSTYFCNFDTDDSSLSYFSDTGTDYGFTVNYGKLYDLTTSDTLNSTDGYSPITELTNIATTYFAGNTPKAMTTYNGTIYILDDNSPRSIYKYTGATCTDTLTGNYTTGTTVLYFALNGGKFFAGYNDCFFTGNIGEAVTLTPVSVASPVAYTGYGTDVYSVTSSTNFLINKLVSGVFTNIATVTGTGSISIGMMDSNTMAVGNSSGLHFLDLSSSTLTTVATDSISAIYVKH